MQLHPDDNTELTLMADGAASHKTRVEDANGCLLLISAPVQGGIPLSVPEGTKVAISYIVDTIGRQSRLVTEARVAKRLTDSIPMLQLEITGPWQRIQERNFVRVDVLLPAAYACLVEGERESLQSAQITNLGGGGVFLVTKTPLAVEAMIWLSLTLDGTVLEMQGVVRRAEVLPNGGCGHGIAFEQLDEKTRQLIIQFVFQRQLELKRKGLVGQKR